MGAAYVFSRVDGTWTESSKLVAPDGYLGSGFGWSVAISGDLVAVGANSGPLHVFRLEGSTWLHETDLKTYFPIGNDVAVSGDVLVTGSYWVNGFPFAGVFRFDGTDWQFESQLSASSPGELNRFGTFVDVSGDVIVVGDYGDGSQGDFTGAAYAFGYDGANWIEETKLISSDALTGEAFGLAVAVDEERVAIGAPFGDKGAVYIYERMGGGWPEQAKLDQDGWFGGAVALRGDVLVAGDLDGLAYVYRNQPLTDPVRMISNLQTHVANLAAAGELTPQLASNLLGLLDTAAEFAARGVQQGACRSLDRFESVVHRGAVNGDVSHEIATELIDLAGDIEQALGC